MKRTAILLSAPLIALLFVSQQAVAQDLEPNEQLPKLSAEQRAERGASNFTAMSLAFMVYAQQQGQSVAEAGRFVGEFFAESWGEEVTPAYFVSAMNNNWQMYGLTTEVLEVNDDRVRAQRGRIPVEQFLQVYAEHGITMEDVDTFFEHAMKGITAARGLDYAEKVEDDRVVFTVSVNE